MKNSGFDEKQGLTFENCCNQVPQGVEDSVVTSVLLILFENGDMEILLQAHHRMR